VSQPPQERHPTVHVEGDIIGSQFAVGSGISQTHSTTIGSFQEAYGYLDGILAKEQTGEILSLLKVIEADLGKDNVKPSNLRRLGELASTYGPVVRPVVDFVLRAVGAKT